MKKEEEGEEEEEEEEKELGKQLGFLFLPHFNYTTAKFLLPSSLQTTSYVCNRN